MYRTHLVCTGSYCRKYIEGKDPVTGKPVIDEIIQAITAPLTEKEKAKAPLTGRDHDL